jgi:RNA polymerase sigma-70 factor (ECF subfamily)
MGRESTPKAESRLSVRAAEEALRSEPNSPAAALDFDAVYNEHAAFVFRVLRGMGVPDASADDAMQDVFLVVHRRLPEFDGRAKVSTWLFQIAVNVALNYRRRARRARDQTPVRDTLIDGARSPSDEAETTQELQALQQVLAELDDEKRMTLLLADLEERSAPEIAELTGTPLNTVYTRLRRARAAFVARWRVRQSGGHRG